LPNYLRLEDNHCADLRMIRDKETDRIAILTGIYAKIWECLIDKKIYYPSGIQKELSNLIKSRQTVYKYLRNLESNNIVKKISPVDVEIGKIIVSKPLQSFLESRNYDRSLTVYTTKWKQVNNKLEVLDSNQKSKVQKKLENQYESISKLELPFYITIILCSITLVLNLIALSFLTKEVILPINCTLISVIMIYNLLNRKYFVR